MTTSLRDDEFLLGQFAQFSLLSPSLFTSQHILNFEHFLEKC